MVLKWFKRFKSDNRGSILHISLLVMSVIIVGALLVGRIICEKINFSKNLELSQRAFYAAETSAEKALFELRKNDVELKTLNMKNYNYGKLDNGAEWRLKSFDKKKKIFFSNISKNTFEEIYIYNTGEDYRKSEVESIWFYPVLAGKIQVIIYPYDYENETWEQERKIVLECIRKQNSNCAPMGIDEIQTDRIYKLQIKALQNDINDLTIIAYNIDGEGIEYNQVFLPTGITLVNDGFYSDFWHRIEVQIDTKKPWRHNEK
jgi:hypothetical protein